MEYQELLDLMTKLDAQRLVLVVHPDEEAEITEVVRRIGDEALRKGQPILAPNIVPNQLVEPGEILIMQPQEGDDEHV